MLFTVTYRSNTGAKAEVEVEAASRVACVAECKSRGIAPMAIREGRASSRSRAAETAAPHARSASRGTLWRAAILAAILAVLGGGIWLWLSGRRGGDETAPNEQQRGQTARTRADGAPVRHAGPQRQDEVEVHPTSEKSPDGPARAPAVAAAAEPAPRRVVSVVTNDAGFILTTIEENGKTTIQTDTLHPPVFKNPMHQLIAAAVAGSSDSEIAPLPLGPGDEAAMREALKVEIKDLPDDTDEVKRMKDAVRATKEDIAALLDKGVSVSEIFTEHRTLWNENLKIRNEMKASYQRLLQDGDDAAAAQYLEKINGSFREMGIPEITPEEMSTGGKRKRRKRE